ncbi:ribosome-binding factor A-like protein, partial [Fusobacterium sp. CM21]
VSVLGDEKKQKDTLEGLKSAMPYLRSQLAKSINLRNTPELRFQLDTSIEYGMHMSALINQVKIKDEENNDELDEKED